MLKPIQKIGLTHSSPFPFFFLMHTHLRHWLATVYTIILIFVITSDCFLYAQNSKRQNNTSDKYKTWVTPSPSQQLYIEGLDDRKGMGRIFVPAMSSPASEPYYAVYQGDEQIGQQRMGSSFFLQPGEYTVLLGSGTLDQRLRRDLKVARGQTVIVEPTWCAISIEVIDETRDYFKKDLQIYHNVTLENVALIPAINPELGEQVQTVLIDPGLYKIVERGGDPNTFINFTTVKLEEGTYTPFTVVISSQSSDFIGAGILTSSTRLVKNKNWKMFAAIHGSVLLNSANSSLEKDEENNISLLTQIESRILYDKLPHYYLSNNLLEMGALRQEKQNFNISQDRLQLKNTYVYYILPNLGGYLRGEAKTHIFVTTIRFDGDREVEMRDLNDSVKVRKDISKVKLEPPLFPLSLKEGLGVNYSILRTFNSRLSIRSGFGYRQIYNSNVYQLTSDPNNLSLADSLVIYSRSKDVKTKGIETSIISSLAILRNLTITTEADILFPIGEPGRPNIDWRKPVVDLENISTLAVTRNISIEHTFRLSRNPRILDWTVVEQFVTVRLSYFIF